MEGRRRAMTEMITIKRKGVERKVRNDFGEIAKAIMEECIQDLILLHEYLNPLITETFLKFPEYRLKAWIYQMKFYRGEKE